MATTGRRPPMRIAIAFALAALAFTAVAVLGAAPSSADKTYEGLEARYVREFLRRYPVVSTYLGGSGLDPALAAADGALRDWSPAARAAESRAWHALAAD